MIIGLDARRLMHSGIGRTTANILETLLPYKDTVQILVFAPATARLPTGVLRVDFDAPILSSDDLYGLPRLIERNSVDLFIAPQFYVSPLIPCRSVRVIHDLWPLNNSEWLPTTTIFGHRFGKRNLRALRDFVETQSWNAPDELPEPSEKRSEIWKIIGGLYAAGIQAAERIVTVSEHSKKEIQRVFPEAVGKTSVAYHYVSSNLLDEFQLSGQLAEATDRPYVLHVGKWEPRKNQERLVRAYLSLPQKLRSSHRLLLVGDDRGIYADHIGTMRSLLRSIPEHLVRHVGPVSDSELGVLYKRASLLALPSLHEGFGIPGLEAMHVGTPVLASNAGALPEVCGRAARYVDPKQETDIMEGIAYLLSDDNLSHRLRREGRKRSRSFSRPRFDSAIQSAISLEPSRS